MVFTFISASVAVAGFQVLHARSLLASQAKLQAIYAAESAIYAVFDADQDMTDVPLFSNPMMTVRYSGAKLPSGWIVSTGSVTTSDWTYTAQASGYVQNNAISLWAFK